MGRERDKRGRFLPGNKSGKKFEIGNEASSKYDVEYCERMLKYFRSGEKYPQFEEFADSINVTTETLNNWREKHEEFDAVYVRCKELQRMKLNKFALLGTFNASYAKFIAVNHHDMSDKSEHGIEGLEGWDVKITIDKPENKTS